MTFNPEISKQQLQSFMIAAIKGVTLEEAVYRKCLGNSGSLILETAIQCLFVGLFSEALELLQEGHQRMQFAIERREDTHPGRGIVLQKYALCEWLVYSGREDLHILNESVEWTEHWFNEQKTKEKASIQLSATAYLQATRYETFVRRIESVGLTKPKNLRRIQGEGTMCYVIARHRLGLEYTAEEIDAALNTFLKRQVGRWLSEGLYYTAARWMKIAHWKPGDDPIATILRVYDYLPDIEPPEYPPK